jgi:NADH:ubiquinone oxidoreductase subunit H
MANTTGRNGVAKKEVMDAMVTFLKWEIGLLWAAFALVIFYQMLTGRINLTGLLREKKGAADFSPGRVQLLFFTFIFALAYIANVMKNPCKLPDLPQEMVWVLGGSNLTYLGLKAYNLLPGLPRF